MAPNKDEKILKEMQEKLDELPVSVSLRAEITRRFNEYQGLALGENQPIFHHSRRVSTDQRNKLQEQLSAKSGGNPTNDYLSKYFGVDDHNAVGKHFRDTVKSLPDHHWEAWNNDSSKIRLKDDVFPKYKNLINHLIVPFAIALNVEDGSVERKSLNTWCRKAIRNARNDFLNEQDDDKKKSEAKSSQNDSSRKRQSRRDEDEDDFFDHSKSQSPLAKKKKISVKEEASKRKRRRKRHQHSRSSHGDDDGEEFYSNSESAEPLDKKRKSSGKHPNSSGKSSHLDRSNHYDDDADGLYDYPSDDSNRARYKTRQPKTAPLGQEAQRQLRDTSYPRHHFNNIPTDTEQRFLQPQTPSRFPTRDHFSCHPLAFDRSPSITTTLPDRSREGTRMPTEPLDVLPPVPDEYERTPVYTLEIRQSQHASDDKKRFISRTINKDMMPENFGDKGLITKADLLRIDEKNLMDLVESLGKAKGLFTNLGQVNIQCEHGIWLDLGECRVDIGLLCYTAVDAMETADNDPEKDRKIILFLDVCPDKNHTPLNPKINPTTPADQVSPPKTIQATPTDQSSPPKPVQATSIDQSSPPKAIQTTPIDQSSPPKTIQATPVEQPIINDTPKSQEVPGSQVSPTLDEPSTYNQPIHPLSGDVPKAINPSSDIQKNDIIDLTSDTSPSLPSKLNALQDVHGPLLPLNLTKVYDFGSWGDEDLTVEKLVDHFELAQWKTSKEDFLNDVLGNEHFLKSLENFVIRQSNDNATDSDDIEEGVCALVAEIIIYLYPEDSSADNDDPDEIPLEIPDADSYMDVERYIDDFESMALFFHQDLEADCKLHEGVTFKQKNQQFKVIPTGYQLLNVWQSFLRQIQYHGVMNQSQTGTGKTMMAVLSMWFMTQLAAVYYGYFEGDHKNEFEHCSDTDYLKRCPYAIENNIAIACPCERISANESRYPKQVMSYLENGARSIAGYQVVMASGATILQWVLNVRKYLDLSVLQPAKLSLYIGQASTANMAMFKDHRLTEGTIDRLVSSSIEHDLSADGTINEKKIGKSPSCLNIIVTTQESIKRQLVKRFYKKHKNYLQIWLNKHKTTCQMSLVKMIERYPSFQVSNLVVDESQKTKSLVQGFRYLYCNVNEGNDSLDREIGRKMNFQDAEWSLSRGVIQFYSATPFAPSPIDMYDPHLTAVCKIQKFRARSDHHIIDSDLKAKIKNDLSEEYIKKLSQGILSHRGQRALKDYYSIIKSETPIEDPDLSEGIKSLRELQEWNMRLSVQTTLESKNPVSKEPVISVKFKIAPPFNLKVSAKGFKAASDQLKYIESTRNHAINNLLLSKRDLKTLQNPKSDKAKQLFANWRKKLSQGTVQARADASLVYLSLATEEGILKSLTLDGINTFRDQDDFLEISKQKIVPGLKFKDPKFKALFKVLESKAGDGNEHGFDFLTPFEIFDKAGVRIESWHQKALAIVENPGAGIPFEMALNSMFREKGMKIPEGCVESGRFYYAQSVTSLQDPKARQRIIDEFQYGPNYRQTRPTSRKWDHLAGKINETIGIDILIISYGVGGVGLDLDRAAYTLSLTPVSDYTRLRQARGRTARITQQAKLVRHITFEYEDFYPDQIGGLLEKTHLDQDLENLKTLAKKRLEEIEEEEEEEEEENVHG